MDCPVCGLISPDTAQRCDCGYDFDSRRVKRPYLDDRPPSRAGDSWALRLIAGVLGVTAGTVLWLLTFLGTVLLSAASGRQQDFPLGPLVTGAVQIVGALLTLFSPRVGGSLMLLAAASSLMLVSDLNGNIFGALTVCWLLAVPGILALLGSTGSNISQSRGRAQSVSGNPSIQG